MLLHHSSIKKCCHIIKRAVVDNNTKYPDNVDTMSNSSVDGDKLQNNNLLHNNTYVELPCHNVAIRNHSYCRSHLKFHQEDYEKFLDEQKMQSSDGLKTKYKFAKSAFRLAYKEKLSSGNFLYDLRDDIAVLALLMEQLLDEPRILKHELIIKIIDQQRKCLSTMNDIRKTTMTIFSQEKMNTMLEKIIEIINRHITEPELKKKIATDFVIVSKEFGETEK